MPFTRAIKVLRPLTLLALTGLFFGALLVGQASAYTIVGGTPGHPSYLPPVYRTMVDNVLLARPGILAAVEKRFPLFTVYVNYGGQARLGEIDVSRAYVYPRFTDLVAHELAHELQIGNASLTAAWLALLTQHGYGPATWHYGVNYQMGLYDPFECFAENVKRAFYSPYYTVSTTPRTCLDWFSRAEMMAFLKAQGVTT